MQNMSNKPTYQELKKRVKKLEAKLAEQKKTTDALRSSERRFKELIKNSSDSIVILNKDGLQTYVSDAVEKHLGFKPQEVINISVIEEMIHPDDQQKTLAAFTKIIEQGEGGVQYRHRHKNGSWVYLEAWGTNQLNNPDIQGVVVNVRDITEWKKAENALKKSEEKFRIVFKTSPNVITLTSIEDGTYIDINDAFTKLLGYSKKDIIGKSSIVFNIWNDLKDRELLISGLKKCGIVENLEAEFKGKNGQIIIGLMSACTLDIDDGKYLLAITQDITEKKEADKAMRLMQYGVDRASDCIFWMNSKARFIYVNDAACNLLGYSHGQLLSMNLNQVDPKFTLDAWPDRLAQLKQVNSDRFESKHRTRDGRLIPVEVTSSYVFFEGEEGVFSFARDITEQKQAEQETIKAQKIADEHEKMALVGQIAGKMAHDFNNVLAVIMGNAQLSLIYCKEAKTIKCLELIFNQTIRGKNLTKNLVVFAKDQEPKQEFFRLNEKIDLVFNLLK
ncbi:MAG: PAS domain S-box protein, partial [Desulfobacula sp.]|nr:PAS domain S-box protein [Desulfobacula sp.]